jgi:hypothetical protein
MDRRRSARRRLEDDDSPLVVRLRSGPEIAIADVSPYGLRGRTHERLCPGARVGIHLFGPQGRVFARAAVVRSRVEALAGDRIQYEVGLALEVPLDMGSAG